MDETKSRYIVRGCGILLCILFFTLPLVQCSQDSNLTASGWEIATGTGQLYSYGNGTDGDPVVFLLLIIPGVLLTLAFLNKSFAILRNISIAGLAAKIIFLIVANARINSSDYQGAYVLTGYNWLVVLIYVGLVGFTYYCAKRE